MGHGKRVKIVSDCIGMPLRAKSAHEKCRLGAGISRPLADRTIGVSDAIKRHYEFADISIPPLLQYLS